MGKKDPVSNDIQLSNLIKKYFNSLGNFFCIEPSNINLESKPDIVFDNKPKPQIEYIKTSINDSDTEDEDAPELIETK